MKQLSILIAVVSLMITVSGCAKIRQLTRRDYQSLQDPFLDSELADTSLASSTGSSAPTNVSTSQEANAGVVQIPDSQPAQPTRTVSATTQIPPLTAADSSNKFPGVRASGSGNRSYYEAPSDPVPASTPVASHNRLSAGGIVKDMKNLQIGQQAAQMAKDEAIDFASWASEQKKNFEKEAKQQIAQQTEPLVKRASELVDSAATTLAQPLIQPVSGQEVAEPLILQPPGFSTVGLQKSAEEIRTRANNVSATAAATFAEIESNLASKAEELTAANPLPNTEPPSFNPSDFSLDIPQQTPLRNRPSITPLPASQSPTNRSAAARTTPPNPFAALAGPSRRNSTATQLIPASVDSSTNKNPFDTATMTRPKAPAFPDAQSSRPAVPQNESTTLSKPKADAAFTFDSGWRPSDLEQ